MERKNINRGFKQLRVWNDAVDLYIHTSKLLSECPLELKQTVANCIDSSHSISRNIAEGYSRQSIKEYLRFLYIALGSSGEYHSCISSFYKADQITKEEYELIDKLHYKTENELIQLIKSLQKKMKNGMILSSEYVERWYIEMLELPKHPTFHCSNIPFVILDNQQSFAIYKYDPKMLKRHTSPLSKKIEKTNMSVK